MRIAGIDQGTTSTRALVADADGRLEVVHAVEHRQSYPQSGWVEHDPEELIRNIQACIDAIGKVDAVGIDNQGESCLAWDAETKEALSPIIVWQDDRTTADLDRLRADGVETETLQRAGLPLDPYFSASKLAWIVRTLPKAKAAQARGTLRLGTTDAFFLDRLTGRFVTDVTTASRTSLMNLETRTWDETLCDLFGVPIECLPDIEATTGDFGAIQSEHGSTPVTASVVDQQAALYGFGCRRKGDAKVTFGTGAFALTVTGEEIVKRPDLGLLPTVAWQRSNEAPVYALDGGVFTASAAINWARSLGLFSDYTEIDAFDGPPAIESGLAFVPALSGLGCPHWAPRARGVWLGLSLDHTPRQMVRSILEGVALRTAEVVEAMNGCVPLSDTLLIDGGMSKNPYFVQFLADVTGRDIAAASMPELTGLGTIQLAGDVPGAALDIATDFRTCSPRDGSAGLLEKFRNAVAMSKGWSETAAPPSPRPACTGNDEFLLTPGPLTTSLSVKEAMLRDWGSRDPAFIELNADIRRRLVDAASGGEDYTCVPVQGSGTFAIEATLGTLVPREGKLLVLVNGAYGERMVKIMRCMGREVIGLSAAENATHDPGEVQSTLQGDPAVTHVAAVHCETTSGILNPIEPVADIVHAEGRALIVDAMSSFGALPLDARALNAAAVVASSNKCLEGAPGMGYAIVRKDVLEACEGNAHSLALDLFDQWRSMEANGQWRFTPPTHVMAAFRQALIEHEAEGGVPGRYRRYSANCDVLVRGMRDLGFEPLLPAGSQAPIIVTFHMPRDIRFVFDDFYDRLAARGYVIYPGKLTVAPSFRIGCIGQVTPDDMRHAVQAIGEELLAMGVKDCGGAAAAETKT